MIANLTVGREGGVATVMVCCRGLGLVPMVMSDDDSDHDDGDQDDNDEVCISVPHWH